MAQLRLIDTKDVRYYAVVGDCLNDFNGEIKGGLAIGTNALLESQKKCCSTLTADCNS